MKSPRPRLRSRLARAALFSGLALAVLALGALAPALFRTDSLTFSFAGEVGVNDLDEPIGVAVVGNRIFVTDTGRNRLVKFDLEGRVLAIWEGEDLGLARPMHLTASGGLLYVADYLLDRVVVIDTAGSFVRSLGAGSGTGPSQLDAPGGAAVLGQQVYVADFFNHRVEPLDAGGLETLGRPGRALPGRLNYPTDVAASDSLLFVADAYNHRVQVFRPDGITVRTWGGPMGWGVPGPFKGWFKVATGIEVAADRVYVADFFNDRIQLFDPSGRYLGQISESLSQPADVAVGPDGTVFVADFGNGRIARFRPGTMR